MRARLRLRLFAVMGSTALFAGCGGGGGDPAAAPSQNQLPAPARPAVITIFSNPTAQEYASLGASTVNAGDGYSPAGENARLTDVSLDAADQPLLRFTTAGNYEIRLPGEGFGPLAHYAGLQDPTSDNNFFQPVAAPQNFATFIISRSRFDGYRHSELASWSTAGAIPRAGMVAIGTPTPAVAIPASESSTYRGPVFGMVDITARDNLYGGWFFLTVDGTVTLTVDFAGRSIEGTLAIVVEGRSTTISTPLSPTALVHDAASVGSFVTSQSGFNELQVRLTGPTAEELTGSWAVPIVIDGQPHQLMGAWIALRRP